MSEVIRHQGHAYVLATSPRLVTRSLTLKSGDAFAVFDQYGDCGAFGSSEQGVFVHNTRMLSRHELRLGDQRPLLLSSTVHETNAFVAVDLTNPDIRLGEEELLVRGSIHVFRSQFLDGNALFCRTRVENFADIPLESDLTFLFEADFADVFEVRGMERERRGESETRIDGDAAVIAYRGLDGIDRRTTIRFSRRPDRLMEDRAAFTLHLPPHEPIDLVQVVAFGDEDSEALHGRPAMTMFSHRREQRVERLRARGACGIETGNDQFNHWIHRSTADLQMLVTRTPHGPYPYAGVPWFSTVFGRDGIITALQYLWVDPRVARGVLACLAATQAEDEDPENDAEPGKILHEARDGEMANTGEVPFRRYYGTADATPLFVMLAAAYHRRTGDEDFLRGIWPNLLRALEWIDRYGDPDGDGFVEYARKRPDGLRNQGWKDSDDSISHADGTLAEPPIALCEVQGYVYAARRGAARLARALGEPGRAEELEQSAERLRRAFEKAFWLPDMRSYALALDGEKRPCRVVASNAGHALYTGICTPERARRAGAVLMGERMFSGWGVRTLAEGEVRYNPMSYHNGSVWPHDSALVGAGLARYGMTSQAQQILGALFGAALAVDFNRLPELFCGFPSRPGQGPTLYPVACIPQAWAAGSVFMLLQATLGLHIEAHPPRLSFNRPSLPESLPSVTLRNLHVGAAEVDLLLTRNPQSVGVNVLRRVGEVAIEVVM